MNGNPYFPRHALDSMGNVAPSMARASDYNGGPCSPNPCAQPLWGPCGPPDASRAAALSTLAAEAGLTREGLYSASRLSAAAKVEIARGDDVMYGLDSGAANIAAGATATVTVTPQKRHIPTRITLSATVANNFVINDIRTGVEPILITVGAISAAIFIQDSTVPPFRSVVCEVGMDFSLTVTNVTGANQRFTCTVVGKYLPWALEAAQHLLTAR